MFDIHEALREMHKGNVVQFVGTNYPHPSKKGAKFCMIRGSVMSYPTKNFFSRMAYDPQFLYELTGETVDTTKWPFPKRKSL